MVEFTPVAKVKLIEVPMEQNAAGSYLRFDVSASSDGCACSGELLIILAFPSIFVAPSNEPSLGLGLFRDPLKNEQLIPIINDFSLLSIRETGVLHLIEGCGVMSGPNSKVKLGGSC
jgi:hypothetical protein